MQVALIPPVCQLHRITNRKYQMVIPEALSSGIYRSTYRYMRNKFILLDNGMFESCVWGYETLIALALEYQVDEIVMPDVRDEMNGTLQMTDSFLDMFCDSEAVDKKIGLQIVVQYSEISQVHDFISAALEMEWRHFGAHGVFTFGILRRLVEKSGDYARVSVADMISLTAPKNPIHLLGYARLHNPTFNEVQVLANNKQVRSIDTDAPFVWSARQSLLSDGVPRQRQERYFHLEPFLFEKDLLDKNIKLLDEWANG